MDQLRKLYTQAEIEVIENFAEARKNFNSKPENFALTSELEGKHLLGMPEHDYSFLLPVSISLNFNLSLIVYLPTCAINYTDALLPPQTHPKELNNDQVVMILSNLMEADYHQDIGKLKGKQAQLLL